MCFSSIRASDSRYSAVIPWAVRERGQTFLDSAPLGGWQCWQWTTLDVDSSLLSLGASKHVQDIPSQSVGQFSV